MVRFILFTNAAFWLLKKTEDKSGELEAHKLSHVFIKLINY